MNLNTLIKMLIQSILTLLIGIMLPPVSMMSVRINVPAPVHRIKVPLPLSLLLPRLGNLKQWKMRTASSGAVQYHWQICASVFLRSTVLYVPSTSQLSTLSTPTLTPKPTTTPTPTPTNYHCYKNFLHLLRSMIHRSMVVRVKYWHPQRQWR